MKPSLSLIVLSFSGAPALGQEALFAVGGAGRQLIVHEAVTGIVLSAEFIVNKPDSFWRMTHDGERILGIDQAFAFHPDRLFSIHPADAHGFAVGNTGQLWNNYAIEWVPQNNTLWVVQLDEVYRVDRYTGMPSFDGYLTGLRPFDSVIAMAVDAAGVVYATGSPIAGQPDLAVYRLDLVARTAVVVAGWPFTSLPSHGWFTDLAFTSNGILWGVFDSWNTPPDSGLYRLNLQTLSAVQVLSQPNSFYLGIAVGPLSPVSSYCTAKLNSLGCAPVVSSHGIASATGVSGFRVEAANVQNAKHGAVVHGISGQAALPFAGGTLCVAAPTRLTAVVNSGGSPPPTADCTGVLSLDFNAYLQTQPVFAAGTTFQCQWLSRDPGFAPPNNLSLSNALEFTLLP